MGGRVAEEITLGPDNVTTGAGQDMSQATELAKRYCMAYSMSRLGLSSFTNERSPPSPETLRIIDLEVESILTVTAPALSCVCVNASPVRIVI